jgi:hypothetical protein
MKRIQKGIIGFCLILFVGLFNSSLACSCIGERPPREAFGAASAVFLGKVVGGAKQSTEKSEDGKIATYFGSEIYFEIEEAFSGVKGLNKVTIHSGTGGGDCGYWFIGGERYVVYAYGDIKNGFSTGICTRTRTVDKAAEDLAFLRHLGEMDSGIEIHGRVSRMLNKNGENRVEYMGLADITIVITDEKGERINAVTDENGEYVAANLKAGKYQVEPLLPAYFHKDQYSIRHVEVEDKGCATEDFSAIPDGQIKVRVIDSEGKLVKQTHLSLIRTDAIGFLSMNEDIARESYANDEGEFVMDLLPPGEYFLTVNVTFSPNAENSYPPTYYPGVTDRDKAIVIRLGMGEKQEGYTINLPSKLKERLIKGVVS